MLILLAAVEQGLAAGFQGAQNLPGLAELLKIPPEVVPLGVITLGYAGNSRPGASSQRPRRPLRVHREVWQSTSP
jgi:nitroreductase